MDTWLEATGWTLPEGLQLVRTISSIGSAALFGAMIGAEREWQGMEAGLRTHILVAMGAALFTAIPLEAGGGAPELAAIVRGIASGIGFIGAGAILKLAAEREIKGLTTAGSIWLTAAVGFAAGGGYMWTGLITVVISLFVLIVLAWAKPLFPSNQKTSDGSRPSRKRKGGTET